MGTSGTTGAARPVVDERANGDRAVAGGVVVANEGRRGRRAKLMGDERPRTPADDDDGSAEGGRWQVGRQERRRGCGVGCRLSTSKNYGVCVRGGWHDGKNATVCPAKQKRNGQKRQIEPSEIEPSEIEPSCQPLLSFPNVPKHSPCRAG